MTGGAGLGAFLNPTIGPLDADQPSSSPDIVVFLADTFRADNLPTYGATDSVTPNLDRLARRSVRCLKAWSPSSWTLPFRLEGTSIFRAVKSMPPSGIPSSLYGPAWSPVLAG